VALERLGERFALDGDFTGNLDGVDFSTHATFTAVGETDTAFAGGYGTSIHLTGLSEDAGGSVYTILGLIDGREQILKVVMLIEPVSAHEPLTEHRKVDPSGAPGNYRGFIAHRCSRPPKSERPGRPYATRISEDGHRLPSGHRTRSGVTCRSSRRRR